MAARSGQSARIMITSAAVSSTDEAATMSTDGQTVTIDSTGRRHWDRNSTRPVVAIGGTNTTDDFTVDHVRGIVTFTTPHSTSSAYTLDVDYLPASFLGQAKQWDLTVVSDTHDVTAFSTTTTDPQWRNFVQGLHGASVSLSRFTVVDTTSNVFFDRISAQSTLLVELWTDSVTENRYEGFAYVSGDGQSIPLDGVGEESVDLMIDGHLRRSTY